MVEQLKHLVELQLLENRRTALLRNRAETPRRIAELEAEFSGFEQDYQIRKAEAEAARKARKALEQEVADLKIRAARSRSRQSQVKTNKEYAALLKEIDDAGKEIRRREDDILGLMETIEDVEGVVNGLSEKVAERRRAVDEEIAALRAEAERVEEKLARLDTMRGNIRQTVDPELLVRIDVLMEKRMRVAVAAVENGVCQVCHMNLPPQRFIELQRDRDILECPHCHRFIYWPGIEAYQVAQDEVEDA